jgi:F-type H+-transporting ATPase subunit c
MNRRVFWLLLTLVSSVLLAPAVFAAEAPGGAAGTDWIGVAAAFGVGLAAAGCGMGQGRAAAAACEGTARNPGASGPIRTAFILGLIFIESLTIYALAVVFVK